MVLDLVRSAMLVNPHLGTFGGFAPRLLALSAVVAIGCESNGPTVPPPPPGPALEIVPADVALIVGESVQLAVDGAASGITWSSSDPGVVDVRPTGLVTGVSLGTALITATMDQRDMSTRATVVPTPRSCDEPGTTHSRHVTGPERWRVGNSPHHLLTTLEVSSRLTLAPGAIVCGAPGAELRVLADALLSAEGSAEAPVRFTATDSAAPWGGIRGSGAVTLRHARIEHSIAGVGGWYVTIDSSLIRKTQGSGVAAGGRPLIRGSVIEDACLGGSGAAISSAGAVLEDVSVLNSGCAGVTVGLGTVDLKQVRIEGSAGPGLSFAQTYHGRGIIGYGRPGHVEGLRITNGASYPIFGLAAADAAELLLSVPPDSLTGNGRDTLVVHNAVGIAADVRITARLPWRIENAHPAWPFTPLYMSGKVTLEAGASLRIATTYPVILAYGGHLLAQGTAEDPISIAKVPEAVSPHTQEQSYRTLFLQDVPDDTSRLSHVRIVDLSLLISDEHPVIMTDVVFVETPPTPSSAGPHDSR